MQNSLKENKFKIVFLEKKVYSKKEPVNKHAVNGPIKTLSPPFALSNPK